MEKYQRQNRKLKQENSLLRRKLDEAIKQKDILIGYYESIISKMEEMEQLNQEAKKVQYQKEEIRLNLLRLKSEREQQGDCWTARTHPK